MRHNEVGWPDGEAPPPVGQASVSGVDDHDEDGPPIATFWLPDPGSRSGWSLRHVWAKPPEKRPRRMGYQ